jgi:hypothetical protein
MTAGQARRLWAGVLAGCCVAVLAIPEARWHLTDGVCFAFNTLPSWQRAIALPPRSRIPTELPASIPDNFELQLGAITLDKGTAQIATRSDSQIRERIADLVELGQQHGKRPELYAHIGRFYAAIVTLPVPGAKLTALEEKDWRDLLFYMQKGADNDQHNAFFPQMAAACHLALGESKQAVNEWERASFHTTWQDYAYTEVFARWKLLETVYGPHGPRQRFPSIALLRLPHLALLEQTAARISDMPSPTGEHAAAWHLERLLATARNGALIRGGACQVVSGLRGVSIVERAIQGGDINLNELTPKGLEEGRAAFRLRVLEKMGKRSAAFTTLQGEKNDGYQGTIPANSAIEFTGWNTVSGRPGVWTGWLFRCLALGSIVDGSMGLAVRLLIVCFASLALLKLCNMLRTYIPERLRSVLALTLALSVGLLIFIATDIWYVGMWYSLLIGGLGYAASASDFRTKPPSGGTDYITWTFGHGVATGLLLVILFLLTAYSFIFRYADFANVHRYLTGIPSPLTQLPDKQWIGLAWFGVSLPLATAISWAAFARTPLLAAVAEGLAKFSLRAALVTTTVFLLALPVGVYFDRKDVERLNLIAQNEPNYYRKSEGVLTAGYYEGDPWNHIGGG